MDYIQNTKLPKFVKKIGGKYENFQTWNGF